MSFLQMLERRGRSDSMLSVPPSVGETSYSRRSLFRDKGVLNSRQGEAVNKTDIEYLDYTWNPITGCSPCSPGCKNCWARREAETRLRGRFGYDRVDPFRVTFHHNRLEEPLRRRKPTRIAVSFMGDLFHADVRQDWHNQISDIIERCPQHTFLMLTKRPRNISLVAGEFPDNVWLGVSVSNQAEADEKIPQLLKIPAAVRWISYEPALGPLMIWKHVLHSIRCVGYRGIDPPALSSCDCPYPRLDWVVAGCEKLKGGLPGRPMDIGWVRKIRDQCQDAGVPVYMKQMAVGNKVTSDMEQFPEDLRIRQMPRTN